jgi:Trypsin-like peptidase domain
MMPENESQNPELPGGAERFRQLTADGQARYIEHARAMTTFARDHAVPIIFAPPVSMGGKVNGATGFVLRLSSESFVVTASHVLEKYEKRFASGEVLHWQCGKLPPFEPLSRIAWRDKERDIVVFRLSEFEQRNIGPCRRYSPAQWPPRLPREGEMVLVAGFPGELREVHPAGWIGAGPYSALFRVASVSEVRCKCCIEQKDLLSFCDTPVPPPGTKIGGVSGGPVFLVGGDFPIVGVVTEDWYMESAGAQLLEFATLGGVEPIGGIAR